jgi:acyl CoA:acetate/3-ketoacid CoA transferase beta subunit
VRGAPGNTAHHATSYWVPKHSARIFVQAVDFVCGAGGPNVRRIVSNLGVFDLSGPDGTMAIRSLHPGVTIEETEAATGFSLHIRSEVLITRWPTDAELELLR